MASSGADMKGLSGGAKKEEMLMTKSMREAARPKFRSLSFPRQSLRRGRHKSIFPQGSGFQKWKQAQVPALQNVSPSNTLAG